MVQTTDAERVPEAVQTKGEAAVRAYRVAFAMFADRSVAEAVATEVASKYLRIYGPTNPPNTSRLRDVVDEFATQAATAAVRATALGEARRLGAGDDAQDFAGEALVTVMTSYRKDTEKTNLVGFIAKTIKHSMVDAYRRRGVQSRGAQVLTMLVAPSPEPSHNAALRELARVLTEALNLLSEEERTIIVGQVVEDEALSDIARTNGMNDAEARQYLRSGLVKLRRVLTGLDSAPELSLAARIQRVEAALDNLDQKERDVLLRWIMDDLTEAELVRATGTTKQHLKRAQENYRRQLGRSRWASVASAHLDDVRHLAGEAPDAADVFLAVEFEGKTTDDLVPSRGSRHQVSALRRHARASIEARRKR
jgi:RNA polymerase sigma factor (sigma-70 family)